MQHLVWSHSSSGKCLEHQTSPLKVNLYPQGPEHYMSQINHRSDLLLLFIGARADAFHVQE